MSLGIEHHTAYFINTDTYFNKGGSSYTNLLNYSLSKKSLLIRIKQLSNQIRRVNGMREGLSRILGCYGVKIYAR
jgi:hypothetical protein